MRFKKLKALALLLIAVPLGTLQAADARPYTTDKIGDVCLNVRTIKFDHEAGFDFDAYNIRHNGSPTGDLAHTGNGVGTGEYVWNTRSEPALYKAGFTPTCWVKIKCYDKVTGKAFSTPVTLDVKALGKLGLEVNLNDETVTWDANDAFKTVEFTFSKPTHEWDGDTFKDIKKVEGNFRWKRRNTGASNSWKNFTVSDTAHVFYCILEDGVQFPWSDTAQQTTFPYTYEPWVNALEFAIDEYKCDTVFHTGKWGAIRSVTRHLHNGHGVTYETKQGESQYLAEIVTGQSPSEFNYTDYMTKTVTNTGGDYIVNCHDQAIAVLTTAGIVGVKSDHIYIGKFGYSKDTSDLVGIGPCNNPKYNGQFVDDSNGFPWTITPYENSKITADLNELHIVQDPNGNNRSFFGTHGTIRYDSDIFDATINYLGFHDLSGFMTDAQDVDSPDGKEALLAGNGDLQPGDPNGSSIVANIFFKMK